MVTDDVFSNRVVSLTIYKRSKTSRPHRNVAFKFALIYRPAYTRDALLVTRITRARVTVNRRHDANVSIWKT